MYLSPGGREPVTDEEEKADGIVDERGGVVPQPV
jgi:hypothetical protein